LKDTDPAFSPAGRSVAFVRRKSYQVGDIYVVSQTGGETKRLTTEERDIYGLCWTRDGREIVFSSDRSGTPVLWRVPASGGVPHRIAEAGEPAWSPTIARQGARLAFTRQFIDLNVWRAELPVIYDPDGKSERVIASTKTETAPQVSPDGKQVGFTSDRSGTTQVWICDRDGSNPFSLTSFPAPGAQLSAWSPDGRYIAFNSAVAGHWDIYVSPIEGGAPLRLTTESSDDSGPSWSRDGRWVYFRLKPHGPG
jgi:Tol biopolymer transport system component